MPRVLARIGDAQWEMITDDMGVENPKNLELCIHCSHTRLFHHFVFWGCGGGRADALGDCQCQGFLSFRDAVRKAVEMEKGLEVEVLVDNPEEIEKRRASQSGWKRQGKTWWQR